MTGPDPDEEYVSRAAEQAAARLSAVADAAAERLAAVAESAARQLVDVAAMAAEAREVSGELSGSVAKLAKRTGNTEQRTSRLSRRQLVTFALVAVDITLTVFMYSAYRSLQDTNARLKATIATQTRLDVEVLCPLYKLFIDAYDPTSVPASGRAHYEQQFTVIRHGYTVLDCKPAASPPPPTSMPRP